MICDACKAADHELCKSCTCQHGVTVQTLDEFGRKYVQLLLPIAEETEKEPP